MARTCFKTGGFYKPDKETSCLPTVEEVNKEEQRRLGGLYKTNETAPPLVTPEVGRRVNDLIKIDEES